MDSNKVIYELKNWKIAQSQVTGKPVTMEESIMWLSGYSSGYCSDKALPDLKQFQSSLQQVIDFISSEHMEELKKRQPKKTIDVPTPYFKTDEEES